MSQKSSPQISVDVGGTFTDFVFTTETGDVEIRKVLSDPVDPARAVLAGLANVAEVRGMSLSELLGEATTIRHGTTIAANALLTGQFARVGLLTTYGFRDTLEMRRLVREETYNPRAVQPSPLVPRHLRIGLSERIDSEGNVLTPLRDEEVHSAIERLRESEVESIVVAFLNSYANPRHEDQAQRLVSRLIPDAFVAVSSKALPEIKFYERLSTTVFNAAVGPIIRRYLDDLLNRLEREGFKGRLLLVQGNGGMTAPELAVQQAALSIYSGPAGGVEAGRWFAKQHGRESAISLDMGGTSCDVALIEGGRALTTTQHQIGGFQIAYPMLDINSIGAGGGSYIWIDGGGMLRVGPESAGAVPGPASYARGGEKPTITDANLVLGYLDPHRFAGGTMPLDVDRARAALEIHVARGMGLDVNAAAWGAYAVVNANMAGAIRERTIDRGYDPREALLVVGGGAGGCHAACIAAELSMWQVLIPRQAPGFSAFGISISDIRFDFVRTYKTTLSNLNVERLTSLAKDIERDASTALDAAGARHSQVSTTWLLEMRYVGQLHEIAIEVSDPTIKDGTIEEIAERFHVEHRRRFGYDAKDDSIELMNIRAMFFALAPGAKPAPRLKTAKPKIKIGAINSFFGPKHGHQSADLINGPNLTGGQEVSGPCIIVEPYTTVVVPPHWRAQVDALGNFLLIDDTHRTATN